MDGKGELMRKNTWKHGVCPLCKNEDDLNTEDSYPEDDRYIYEMSCGACEASWTEVCTMTPAGLDCITDANGNDVDDIPCHGDTKKKKTKGLLGQEV